MRKLITILIVIFASISCGKIKEAHTSLNDIETFINEHPDSALTLLDSFAPSHLEHKSIWAHHSLLHAQAKDKCYIDETDDSLMTQVVNYYEGKRDKEKLFKAYYYLGRIQYNSSDYAAAMLSYIKAEQVVTGISDDFAKGLLYAQLGKLHHKYFDYPRSLESYEQAQLYYKASGRTSHQYFVKLDVGQIYQEENNFVLAERLYREVIEWAYINDQLLLCDVAVGFLLTLYDENNLSERSIELLNSKYGSINPHSLYAIRSKSLDLALKGNRQAVYMDIWSSANSISDTVNNYFYEYSIAKLQGEYDKAIIVYEKLHKIQDSLITLSMKHPLLETKNSFLQTENEIMQMQIRSHRIKILIILFFIVIVTVSSAMIFKHKIALKDLEIAHYVDIAEDLEVVLVEKKEEIQRLCDSVGIYDRQSKESAEFIANMLSKQYELLNKLTTTYYETHGCNKDKEAIYRHVSKEIELLSSDKKAIHQLEEVANCYKGNIMKIIREKLPALSEMEYRLLCYLCVGFSAKAISIFTGDTTNNIYVKKSRIKNAILKLDEETKSLILASINSQDDNTLR